MAPAHRKQKPSTQQAQADNTANTGTRPADQAQAPVSENQRIKNRKLQVIASIQKRVADPVWIERLLKIAHGDESKIMRAVNSYSTFIANDGGGGRDDNKKYVCEASLSSLFSCFLEAFQLGLDIGGGRDLVAIVVRGQTAELEITYKGFANALSRHFDNPFIQFGNLYEGDIFIPKISDSSATFIHEPKDPLNWNYENLKGAYCYFSYTNRDNKKEVSRLVWIDRPTIVKIRESAKTKHVWDKWWSEMVLKAVIRRASKVPFASIDFDKGEIDPATVDNQHFLLDDKSAGGDRMSKLMQRQQEIIDEDEKPTGKPKEAPKDDTSCTELPKGDNASPETAQGQQSHDAKAMEGSAVRFEDKGNQEGTVIENNAAATSELTEDDFSEVEEKGKNK